MRRVLAVNDLVESNRRGVNIFSSEKLQKVWRDIVLPELEVDPGKSIVAVGSITATGMRAAIIFRKPVQILNLKGEWIVEGAFLHEWSGLNEQEAKVLFKL